MNINGVPSCGGAVCSCRGDWTCESAAAGGGGGGGGEGLFPLRCVTALAAADCRRLAGVSAAVSECSHPSASYHPHWRLCFVALILSSASYHLTGDSALRFEASCEFFKGWVNKAIKISWNKGICLLGYSTPKCNNQCFFSGKGIRSAEIDSPYTHLLLATNQGAEAPLMKLAGCSGLITITNDTPSRVPPRPPPFCLVCCRPAAPTPAQHQTLIRPCPPPS